MKKNTPHLFFLLLVLVITAAFFGLIKDFLLAVFWAIVLSILFHSTYRYIGIKLKGRKNAAAGLTLLSILLLVIIPLTFLAITLVNESLAVYEQIQDGDINIQERIDRFQEQIPELESYLENFGVETAKIRESIGEAIASATQNLAGKAIGITQNIFGFIVQFFLMLYILFFFLRDGRRLIHQLVWVLPLGDENERKLLARFASVARATVKGSLIVALVQGTIGGLLFWAVGIPAAVLWGFLMTILSLLPIGSGLVWGPAAIILFTQGEIGKAIAILIVGALVIGLVDNLLRPRLVGNDTKMPDYLILLSTLGGLAWFGLSGFVLGPIIAAFFVTCWAMLGEEFR
ncbi:AI-2E family transporter [Flavilitoribacter nigricans]|uniref:AI-2E family transporter n=1 Tax=Flavilitoribacter nigricans (strain ATCC 23147 / DSM 23189 / NBRC 102662 / NCIMB 1420 / SS-2) TaxID=1122177 RepID=A0A2D0N644_FLAN2|nr:AI-2E family transporter [Flavilitoribacter nigricans]PHN04002.1 AI-2E family transporter [Flavilitoribacter nigricans DSM 23189 = NBRC 102662]